MRALDREDAIDRLEDSALLDSADSDPARALPQRACITRRQRERYALIEAQDSRLAGRWRQIRADDRNRRAAARCCEQHREDQPPQVHADCLHRKEPTTPVNTIKMAINFPAFRPRVSTYGDNSVPPKVENTMPSVDFSFCSPAFPRKFSSKPLELEVRIRAPGHPILVRGQ